MTARQLSVVSLFIFSVVFVFLLILFPSGVFAGCDPECSYDNGYWTQGDCSDQQAWDCWGSCEEYYQVECGTRECSFCWGGGCLDDGMGNYYCYDGGCGTTTCTNYCNAGCARLGTDCGWVTRNVCQNIWVSQCINQDGNSCGGGGGRCSGGSCQFGGSTPSPTTGGGDSVFCGNSTDCPQTVGVLRCSPNCGSGSNCWCKKDSSTTSSGGFCNSPGDCQGPAPCPIGLSGPWNCVANQCFANCQAVGGGGGGGGGGSGNGGCNPNNWNSWTTCSGSPATRSRINECGTTETASCTGTIRSRAVIVSAVDSCDAIRASQAPLTGTVHQFTAGSASQPAAQTQNDNGYVTFSNIVGGSYTLAPTGPGNYAFSRACWTKTTNTPSSGDGLTTTLSVPTDSDTLTWDLGYSLLDPWTQTEGGGVYSAGTITSLLPPGITPRVFNLSGAGGYPGAVFYGDTSQSPYDFDSDYQLVGSSLVSSTNWLVNQSFPTVDWYQYYFVKLGGPPTADSLPGLPYLTKPPSRAKAYYLKPDPPLTEITTQGDWVVGSGETLIFLVDGNLSINGKITTTGTGFVAFIVKGNITVSSNVGGAYTSSTPVIEGLYITSPAGTFQTGASSVAGKERLVLEGTFVAGNFLLQRDLTSVNSNATTAAELFIYDPSLFFNMPDSMRDVSIVWQEVAP